MVGVPEIQIFKLSWNFLFESQQTVVGVGILLLHTQFLALK